MAGRGKKIAVSAPIDGVADQKKNDATFLSLLRFAFAIAPLRSAPAENDMSTVDRVCERVPSR